ncbi:hypothetical protein CcI49_02105 [Frankia sp. CcI49]|uniref:hypothetical protein n=1 Tax=unclassified Frankia TaxID=2632575 RepID=UPI0006CA50C8|nr:MULTISPECIES: hypothetical protein [unclassified Frankia]KPM55536.1 hypothetical protein ACG83_09450 [Frankia sp. R43]ONH62212.1 hypothetical protein CcI49_02105 [Frankia sp. CcI49]
MPMSDDRVVVDPEALQRMISRLGDLRGTLQAQAQVLTAQVAAVPLAVDTPNRLRAVDTWAAEQEARLHRRLVLAEAADPAVRDSPRLVFMPTSSDRYETSEQASGAGRALAEELLRPDPDRPGGQRITAALTDLGARVTDPDFVAGFFDRLGPTGLARLLYRLFVPAGPAAQERAAVILGRGLATYSGVRDLAGAWLRGFSRAGRPGEVETSLLGPLLAHGQFAPALLERLGDLFFGTADGSLHDAGLRPGPRGTADGSRWTAGSMHRDYAAALLRAIAAQPRLATEFATRHLSQVLSASHLQRGGLARALRPDGDAWSAQLEPARAALIAAAGGSAARHDQPAAAREFVVRLVEMTARPDAAHVSAHMRAAFGQILHAWRDDLYAAVTSPLPPDTSAPGAPGLGLTPGQWATLLRESLRGGASAPLLAADAVTFAAGLDLRAWEQTRGYNRPNTGYYPASPRALAYHQSNEVATFFGAALTDVAEAELRDHAANEAAHQRRTAVLLDVLAETVKSIDPTSLVRTLANLARGLTVEIVEDRIRRAAANQPTGPAQAVLKELRAGLRRFPDWQARYRASVADLWRRRGSDPLRPVLVTTADGATRVYTGDPRADGFIAGPADDFLGPTDEPIAVEAMSRGQRAAYERWLASPAIVANNDRVASILGVLPSDVVPGWAPDWARP